MKRVSGLLLLTTLLHLAGVCQKKIVVVMGSSTAYGTGATPIDSSWANLSRFYWDSLGVLDTLYNIAVPASTSYDGMPTGFVPPGIYNNSLNQVDTSANITKAMSLNPDVVIIGYPTNDIGADIPLANYLSNLRTMYSIVTAAGKICYITTTEPRDEFSYTQDTILLDGRDSIEQEFGQYSLDFYDIVVDPNPADSLGFNPALTVDGTHPNNTGHRLLFDYVKANVNLGIPLPLTLLSFTAIPDGKNIQTSWTTASEGGAVQFNVQRSADGETFAPVFQETGKNTAGQWLTYYWTDNHPLPGNNFYRLAMTQNGNTTYSQVVLAFFKPAALIGNIYMQNATSIEAEISASSNTVVSLSVFAVTGDLVAHQSTSVSRSPSVVSVSLPGVASGVYYLRVQTADGQSETRPFIKL